VTFRVRRICSLLAAVLALMAGTPVAATAAAPQGEYAGTLRFEVQSITPALVTDATSTVVIRGSMTNTGPVELTGVVARWQRGEAFAGPAGVRAEIDEPGQPESLVTAFAPVTDVLEAGGTADFTVRTEAFNRTRSGLDIRAPGVYPVMLNVNATFESGPDNGARVGELHSLLTVVSVPGGNPSAGTRPAAVSMLMPLVDRPHRDPTGAFFDDDLAALIRPGGRLEDVLSAAEAPGLPRGSVTLAVDPELLEELQLMAAGYTVGPYVYDLSGAAAPATAGSAPGEPTAPGTGAPPTPGGPPAAGTTAGTTTGTTTGTTMPTPPDTAATAGIPTVSPTGSAPGGLLQVTPAPDAVPGAGTAAAADFLKRLRELSATTAVLVLPYSDIDATAAVRAGRPELVPDAVARGHRLATEILGPQAQLVLDVSWPIDGLVDPATLAVLRSTGHDTAVLDRAGVRADDTGADGDPGNTDTDGDRATVGTGSGEVTAALTSRLPGGVLDVNHLTALIAQRWLSADGTATVIAPPRNWQPDRAGDAALETMLRALDSAGLVEGVRIDEVTTRTAATGAQDATLVYPEQALTRELPQAQFDRIRDLDAAMSATQRAFDDPTPDDPSTGPPDDVFADIRAGMSRQAAGGYRADMNAAYRSNAAVQTVVDTVQSGVSITPPAGVYTLTSSTSPLLITIGNRLPYAVQVRIAVDGAAARRAGLTVTDVGVQTIPAFRSVPVRLPAEVTRAGSLTLRIKLTTPDGAPWGTEQELQLRSTAIGSFTVVLIIAAAAVVLLTSAIRIRKRYRQRRERIAAGLQ
jgi:hypothetical protein